MNAQTSVYNNLSTLRTYEDAAKLFAQLNYQYSATNVSTKRFPSSLDGRIKNLQILAAHDDFKIIHCEVDQLLLGVERPIINNLLRDFPFALFLFSDISQTQWHFINVKYDEEESRRKLFRRIVVGPDERLHTAAERIAMLEVHDEKLSPLELQQKHDSAFDVEAVTKEFFKSFVEMFHLLREDTALDMEVAIDPEMLGKVFENLILQLEKDPKIDLRKSTGSYYTPRVIVHFMCQQSLKEHLVEHSIPPLADEKEKRVTRERIERLFTLNPAVQLTEEEIAWLRSAFTKEEADRMRNLILSCRVCDPAVGSGAFVVGMLHEMVAIIKLLDVLLKGQSAIQERNYDYELKRKIIEYCLYGVDIQEQAVRICELRLWLSLVVDYQGSEIPPLPNLSYRIRQGNSLIDQLFGYNVNLNIPPTTEKGEKLKQLIDSIQNDKHAYFYESDLEKKRKKELGILTRQCDLASMYLKVRQDTVVAEYETKYSKGFFGDRKLKKAEEEEKQTLEDEIKELGRLVVLAKNTKEKLLAVEKGKLRETEKMRRLQ